MTMIMTSIEQKVHDIIEDPSLSKDLKIARLQILQIDARALQRAATESLMVDDDGWQDDLRVIEKALHQLHADHPSTGAATL